MPIYEVEITKTVVTVVEGDDEYGAYQYAIDNASKILRGEWDCDIDATVNNLVEDSQRDYKGCLPWGGDGETCI